MTCLKACNEGKHCYCRAVTRCVGLDGSRDLLAFFNVCCVCGDEKERQTNEAQILQGEVMSNVEKIDEIIKEHLDKYLDEQKSSLQYLLHSVACKAMLAGLERSKEIIKK